MLKKNFRVKDGRNTATHNHVVQSGFDIFGGSKRPSQKKTLKKKERKKEKPGRKNWKKSYTKSKKKTREGKTKDMDAVVKQNKKIK